MAALRPTTRGLNRHSIRQDIELAAWGMQLVVLYAIQIVLNCVKRIHRSATIILRIEYFDHARLIVIQEIIFHLRHFPLVLLRLI